MYDSHETRTLAQAISATPTFIRYEHVTDESEFAYFDDYNVACYQHTLYECETLPELVATFEQKLASENVQYDSRIAYACLIYYMRESRVVAVLDIDIYEACIVTDELRDFIDNEYVAEEDF